VVGDFLHINILYILVDFFFQAEDGIRDFHVTGVQTCALPIFESFFSYFLNTLSGFSLLPFESTKKCFSPKSIPIALSTFGKDLGSNSQSTEMKYFPVELRLTVTFTILPSISLDLANFTQPSLGSLILFPSTLMFWLTY